MTSNELPPESLREMSATRHVRVLRVARSGGASEELVEGFGAFFHDGAELVTVDDLAQR